MKKTVLTIGMMLLGLTLLTVITAFAEMTGGRTGGTQQPSGAMTTAQQAQDEKSGQKVNQEMKRDMAGMMRVMNETMQKITITIDTKMESRNTPVIGKMMREMSVQMNELAGYMAQGRIDPQTITKMQARMDSVNQRLDAI